MRTQIRIVAGSLRGRKLTCQVNPDLRPTPQMVREALFSILGNAVPDRVFVDIFAGTGVIGLEALSRGASSALFIERDARLAHEIEGHLRNFNLTRNARLYRTDAYRWVSTWRAPTEPVNVYLSPPFPDLTGRPDDLLHALEQLQEKVADGSVIVLQSERGSPVDDASLLASWELRRYGRNELLLWQKGEEEPEADGDVEPTEESGEADEPAD